MYDKQIFSKSLRITQCISETISSTLRAVKKTGKKSNSIFYPNRFFIQSIFILNFYHHQTLFIFRVYASISIYFLYFLGCSVEMLVYIMRYCIFCRSFFLKNKIVYLMTINGIGENGWEMLFDEFLSFTLHRQPEKESFAF